jgi:hypothetical protein
MFGFEKVDLDLKVLAEDIKGSDYTDINNCAIAKALKRAVKSAVKSNDVYISPSRWHVQYLLWIHRGSIPNTLGYPEQQRLHPEGFSIPIRIQKRLLRK